MRSRSFTSTTTCQNRWQTGFGMLSDGSPSHWNFGNGFVADAQLSCDIEEADRYNSHNYVNGLWSHHTWDMENCTSPTQRYHKDIEDWGVPRGKSKLVYSTHRRQRRNHCWRLSHFMCRWCEQNIWIPVADVRARTAATDHDFYGITILLYEVQAMRRAVLPSTKWYLTKPSTLLRFKYCKFAHSRINACIWFQHICKVALLIGHRDRR